MRRTLVLGEQAKFLEALDRFSEIGKGVELADDLLAEGAAARDGVEQFRVLIPLVGAFNAGKTTLVNAYLHRPHGSGLPTDIVPQTAWATEIYAAPSADAERVELIGENDAVLREVGLEEFGRVERQTLKTGELEAQYAKAYLHHADLPDSNRKVLVDMPGLDSGLRTHNAAIQRYLPLGGYFFMVVDAEHGTLRQSEIEQLREFLAQEVEFTVLVNKVDKKQATDAEAIVSHIKGQVRQAFDKSAPVCAVSAASDDVAGFRGTLSAIDFEDSLRRYWRARVVRLIDGAINYLHTRYSALNVSTAESERVIEGLERKEEALQEKLSQDERDIKNRYSARAVDRIVRAVRDAIGDAAPTLADTYLQAGKEAGEREINELVRHTLNRVVAEQQADTMRQFAEHYRADIDDINADFDAFAHGGKLPNDARSPIDSNLIDAAGGKIVDLLRRLPPAIGGPLTAAAAFITPWLGIVVGVVSLLSSLFGSPSADRAAQQERRKQELQMRIRATAAPRIASELRPRIEDDYARRAQQMLSNLGAHVDTEIGRVRAGIHKSRAEIEEKKVDIQGRKDALQTAIKALATLKAPLEKRP